MSRDLKVGVYGSFFPPIEQAVEQAVLCEAFGLDVVAFTDQMSGNVPNSAFHELGIAQMWKQQHGFYDALTLAALTAQKTERIGLTIAAIDTVRNALWITYRRAARQRPWASPKRKTFCSMDIRGLAQRRSSKTPRASSGRYSTTPANLFITTERGIR